MSLSDPVYAIIVQKAEILLGESIINIEMLERTQRVNFKQLTIFHDKFDKILPFAFSQKLANGIVNSKLYEYERIGHSRMLQSKDLLADLAKLLNTN